MLFLLPLPQSQIITPSFLYLYIFVKTLLSMFNNPEYFLSLWGISGVKPDPHTETGVVIGVILTLLGLKGGCISSLSTRSQSIQRKKGCSRSSLSASSPPPKRLTGFLVRSCERNRWRNNVRKTERQKGWTFNCMLI